MSTDELEALRQRLRAVEAERDKERDERRNLSVLHEANCHYKAEARRLREAIESQLAEHWNGCGCWRCNKLRAALAPPAPTTEEQG